MSESYIPTNFKVIGFGPSVEPYLQAIKGYDFDGLSVYNSKEDEGILPSDDDKMAIIIVTGDESNATLCAKTFYQAGVLTLAVCKDGLVVPSDSVDSQTVVPDYQISEIAKILLDIVFNPSGYICLDFHDLDNTLRDSENFVAVSIHGLGHSRITSATEDVKDYMENIFPNSIENAMVALYFNKESEMPPVMGEIAILHNYLDTLPKEVNLIWGLYHDKNINGDSVRVSMVLSGKGMLN